MKGGWFSWPLSALLRGAHVGHQLENRLRCNSTLKLICFTFFLFVTALENALVSLRGVQGEGLIAEGTASEAKQKNR